jgi:hypothetical protein
VYEGVSLRCAFCRSRNISEPCIKLRGPKSEEAKPVPHCVGTPAEAAIDPHDFWLLQQALRGWSGRFQRFLDAIPGAFGVTVPAESLRNALIARGAWIQGQMAIPFHGSAFEEKYFLQLQLTHRALKRKMQNPATLDESDAIAVFALSSAAADSRDVDQYRAHAIGLASILEELLRGGHRDLMIGFEQTFASVMTLFLQINVVSMISWSEREPVPATFFKARSYLCTRVTPPAIADFYPGDGRCLAVGITNVFGAMQSLAVAQASGDFEDCLRAYELAHRAISDWDCLIHTTDVCRIESV